MTVKKESIIISAPNFQTAEFTIIGVAPLVINKFSQKVKEEMHRKHEGGSTSKKGQKREAKNFQENYEQAKHIANEGWCGLPASAFRAAMISACRLVGFKMTLAKLAIFIEADGFDRDENTPLIKITKGEPEYFEAATRNETGVPDLRARPMWKPGWEAIVRIRYDADVFTLSDVTHLLMRVGMQVGLCEGRPDSKKSTGMGWGLFNIKGADK